MRLTGRLFGVILGLVAALYVSGCRTALEPYTPAGTDALWQPGPVPGPLRHCGNGRHRRRL